MLALLPRCSCSSHVFAHHMQWFATRFATSQLRSWLHLQGLRQSETEFNEAAHHSQLLSSLTQVCIPPDPMGASCHA